jgi:hypothetical protein
MRTSIAFICRLVEDISQFSFFKLLVPHILEVRVLNLDKLLNLWGVQRLPKGLDYSGEQTAACGNVLP